MRPVFFFRRLSRVGFMMTTDIDTEIDTIGRLRASVDELDRLLVELLNRRAKLALAVAREKARLGLAVRAPGREREVIAHVRQANAGPLDEQAVTRVFRSIIDESRRLQEVTSLGELASPKLCGGGS
jgi:chorismate mutase